uniref:Uncharacterized protein n=1 Tax=Rhabditophanes sp. KR3021 TaxID=114890 RepID=A0AC35TWZ1_9BILA
MQTSFIVAILLSICVASLYVQAHQLDEDSFGFNPDKRAMRNALVRFGRAGMRNALVRFGKRASDIPIFLTSDYGYKRNGAPQPFVRFGRSGRDGVEDQDLTPQSPSKSSQNSLKEDI